MEQILLSREDLAQRWNVSTRCIQRYEEDGIITRVSKLPTPRYNINHIIKLEGTELEPLSPLERRRMQQEIKDKDIIIKKLTEQLNIVRQAVNA